MTHRQLMHMMLWAQAPRRLDESHDVCAPCFDKARATAADAHDALCLGRCVLDKAHGVCAAVLMVPGAIETCMSPSACRWFGARDAGQG